MKNISKCHHCKFMSKCQIKCPEDSKCTFEEDCSEMMDCHHPHHNHHDCYSKESEYCHIPKMKIKCPSTKECVKTYKCCYKLFRFTHYRLFKVCVSCGHEFDHYHHQGICPKCH